MPDDEPILRTQALTRQFGKFVAVDRVSFELPDRELRGLIGPNGAGKTTFFNMLSGVLDPSAGSIWFRGRDITALPPHRRVKLGMAHTFQITSVFPNLTVAENLRGALNGQRRALNPLGGSELEPEDEERISGVLERIGLEGRDRQTVGTLSHADQKLLELGIALVTEPDLLLLDEPSAGLSARATRKITGLIENELHGRLSIILIAHDMELIMEVVDFITVLHQGQILAEGSPEAIAGDERVQKIYFGQRY